jgi:hypothetical protein
MAMKKIGNVTKLKSNLDAETSANPIKLTNSAVTIIEWGWAIIITLMSCCLHFVILEHAGALWRDEANCMPLVQAPSMAKFWNLLLFESFPVPFYLLVRLWTEVMGNSDAALRVFGFLVGISIAAALWFNARTLGRCLPMISMTLFGMNVVALRCGDMIRGYGLGTLFMLLTLAFIWRLVKHPSLPAALLAIFSALGTTQSLYQNAFFVLAICAGGMAITIQHRLWKRTVLILAVGGISAIGLLPYIPLMQREHELLVPWHGFTLPQALGNVVEAFNSSGEFMAGVWGTLFVIGAGIAVAAQFPRTFDLSPTKRDLALYAGVTLALGLTGFWFFFKTLDLEMSTRYYVSLFALIAFFLDIMVAVLPEALLRRLLVLLLSATIVVISFPKAWRMCHMRHTNIDKIAAKLETAAIKDDLIAVIPSFCGTTFLRYYKGVTPWISIPELNDFEVMREDLLRSKLATTSAAASAFEKISQTLKSGYRVWLVGAPIFPQQGQLPPAIPPAPFGPQGWFSPPYEQMWAMETGHLLQTHAERADVVIAPTDEVSPDEKLPLLVFSGWR